MEDIGEKFPESRGELRFLVPLQVDQLAGCTMYLLMYWKESSFTHSINTVNVQYVKLISLQDASVKIGDKHRFSVQVRKTFFLPIVVLQELDLVA